MDWVRDTSIGGAAGPFPSTIWSDVLALRDPAKAREKLEVLARAYWKPVYRFVRAAWGRSNEEAKDLTQAFFLHLLEGDRLARVDPRLGSFRAYLKTSLRNFLANEARDASTLKRGGGVQIIAITDVEPSAESNPEAAFDREWAKDVLGAATDQLLEELAAEGKAVYFDAFRHYYTDGLPYQEVAARLSIGESDVRNYLTYARRILRRILCERIRDYVGGDAAVEDELRAMVAFWS